MTSTERGSQRSHSPTTSEGDALDLLVEVDERLARLFDEWRWHHGRAGGEDPETRDWHRGTIAKMILEDAASRLVVVHDITRVLRRSAHEASASRLARHEDQAIQLVRLMDERSRGVVAEALRYSEEFHEAVQELVDLWEEELLTEPQAVLRLAEDLGPERRRLHGRAHLRGRAPIHPARRAHWYQALPFVERVHAIYDRVRGFPDAMSTPSSDVQLTRRLRGTRPPEGADHP